MILLTTTDDGFAQAAMACFFGSLRWPDVAFHALNADDVEDREIIEQRELGMPTDEHNLVVTVLHITEDAPFDDRALNDVEFAEFMELLTTLGADPDDTLDAAQTYHVED